MLSDMVDLLWAIDWDDTGEQIPGAEGIRARSNNLVAGPSVGSLQTPQVVRGSINVDDWDYDLDPVTCLLYTSPSPRDS